MSTQAARVRSFEPLDRFILTLSFDGGTKRDVDLEAELWGPMFEPLRPDPGLFRQVRVDEELGTIVWPNVFEAADASTTPPVSRATS